MLNGKNLMEERKINTFGFKTLKLKLKSEVQTSNTKTVRTRIAHKGNNNPLKHEEPACVKLISYSTTAPLSTPCIIEDRNHTQASG